MRYKKEHCDLIRSPHYRRFPRAEIFRGKTTKGQGHMNDGGHQTHPLLWVHLSLNSFHSSLVCWPNTIQKREMDLFNSIWPLHLYFIYIYKNMFIHLCVYERQQEQGNANNIRSKDNPSNKSFYPRKFVLSWEVCYLFWLIWDLVPCPPR